MSEIRTDPHRPGAIQPHDYEDVLWYDCGSGEEPSMGVNCMKPIFDLATLQVIPGAIAHAANGTCCILGLKAAGRKFAETGREHGAGKCTVCGAAFRFGMVWEHKPTGDLIHVGHDCADKYSMVVASINRQGWAQYKATMDNRRAEAAKDMKRAKQRDKFIALNDLAEVFAVRSQHTILADMYSRLHQWGSLSEKQVAFARKLATEIKNPPPPKVEEIKVAAPTGRQTFTGTIVSAKWYDSDYGGSTKITVKVAAEGGIWLAWGTLPSGVDGHISKQFGRTITIKGTLTQGNEPHFAFFKRPTLVSVSPIQEEIVNA